MSKLNFSSESHLNDRCDNKGIKIQNCGSMYKCNTDERRVRRECKEFIFMLSGTIICTVSIIFIGISFTGSMHGVNLKNQRMRY